MGRGYILPRSHLPIQSFLARLDLPLFDLFQLLGAPVPFRFRGAFPSDASRKEHRAGRARRAALLLTLGLAGLGMRRRVR